MDISDVPGTLRSRVGGREFERKVRLREVPELQGMDLSGAELNQASLSGAKAITKASFAGPRKPFFQKYNVHEEGAVSPTRLCEEAFLGAFLMGLFVFTLARKYAAR